MTPPPTDVVIRAATAPELARVHQLLAEAELPTADLAGQGNRYTLVALDGADVIGGVAVEPYDDAGLLRSLVVAPALRGRGIGVALVRALEERARSLHLRRLVLLTQTAEPFFIANGYVPFDRAAAPAAMRASPEFASLCPASAACLSKSLE